MSSLVTSARALGRREDHPVGVGHAQIAPAGVDDDFLGRGHPRAVSHGDVAGAERGGEVAIGRPRADDDRRRRLEVLRARESKVRLTVRHPGAPQTEDVHLVTASYFADQATVGCFPGCWRPRQTAGRGAPQCRVARNPRRARRAGSRFRQAGSRLCRGAHEPRGAARPSGIRAAAAALSPARRRLLQFAEVDGGRSRFCQGH